MTKRKRRVVWPMPVQGLIEHPLLLAMPPSAAGMTLRLVMHFWNTECRPIPTNRMGLFAVSRADPRSWAKYRADMLQVFLDVKDELENEFHRRSETRKTLGEILARGRSTQAAARLVRKAPPAADPLEASPVRERERTERPLAPDERGERRRVVRRVAASGG